VKKILVIFILLQAVFQTFGKASKDFFPGSTMVETAECYPLILPSSTVVQIECFNEADAVSSDRNLHRNWAEKQNTDGLKSKIKSKLEQLFRCSGLNDDDLFKDFAAFSIVISESGSKDSCYGGDSGVLNKNWSFHYEWAKGQSKSAVLANLLSKSLATFDCLDREKQVSYYTALSLKLAAMVPIPQNSPRNNTEEARKHFVKGITAAETAKSPADFENAIKEFEIATGLAPNLAAAYFNLGAIQENLGRYEQAISNFRRYLQILPYAKDAQAVKEIITRTEQKFQSNKKTIEIYRKITGVWSFAFWPWFDEYAFYLDGDEMKMKIYNAVPKDLSISFDGKTLKAGWKGKLSPNSYSETTNELNAVFNDDGTMTGTLREFFSSTDWRHHIITMNRNLLRSTYLWQAGFNGVMDWRTLYGGKFILENANKGYTKTFPKAGTHDYERDFSLEAKMTFISGDEGNFYGLMWGNIRNEFYFFGVMATGNYAFRKLVNGNWTEILNARPSTAIRKGNAANTLTVKKKGARMEFYINETLVDTAVSEKYNGFVGFHLNHYMKVEVDYLRMDY